MKRWDQTTLALNVGVQIQRRFDHIHSLLAPYIKQRGKKNAQTTAVEKLLTEVFEHAQAMNVLADIVVGAASSRYPLHGVQPWMLEGAEASIRHPFEEGQRRELLIGAALEKLSADLRAAHAGINAMASDLPNTDADTGILRIGIMQWTNVVDAVGVAFKALRTLLTGGSLEAFDWRDLDLLDLIPEPWRTQIEARLDAKFLQSVAAEPLRDIIKKNFEETFVALREKGESFDSFLARALRRNEMRLYDLSTRLFDLGYDPQPEAANENAASAGLPADEAEEEAEPKISKSALRGREIAAKRQEALQRREEKKRQKLEAKRAAKNVEESGSPPSSDTDEG